MEQENKGKRDKNNQDKRKYHYCVLFTRTLKQWEVSEAIRQALPEGRGTVFYPCSELWMGGSDVTVIKPLFPGYVFIRSDMELAGLHDIIRRRRRDVLSFIKEIHISERRAAGEPVYNDPGLAGEGDESILIDLKDDEAEFLDFMLNFRYEDGEGTKEDADGEAVGNEDASDNSLKADGSKKERPGRIPDVGVLRMSYGYRQGKNYVVMEGPLKGYENHIADVNLRDRKAYLDIEIGGHLARAGLQIRPKRHWFPQDKDAPVMLADGTEIDPMEIARRMMQ